MTDNIKERIYTYRQMEWERKELEHKSSGKWNASMLGGCDRKHFWKRKGESITNPPTIEAMGKMNEGKRQEDDLIKEMKEAGIEIIWEQESVEYKDVVGKIDCATKDEIIEIKSQHSRSFWWAIKNGSILKRGHAFQLGFYMVAKEKERGLVIYKSKDDGSMEVVGVPLLKELKESVENKIKKLNNYWKKEKLPPATPDEKWECSDKWCPYYNKCKEEK